MTSNQSSISLSSGNASFATPATQARIPENDAPWPAQPERLANNLIEIEITPASPYLGEARNRLADRLDRNNWRQRLLSSEYEGLPVYVQLAPARVGKRRYTAVSAYRQDDRQIQWQLLFGTLDEALDFSARCASEATVCAHRACELTELKE
ncbi:hypothetical protein [Biformimicrobium ophioploci]|uniref:Uncharacterized protein n=1 Tax=Biformimicrobium ophioploci TaxID=3036711 RepID=A0ABQ6M2K2_9GAMM|nr:hypothetical protein [Microbulbifer sp. NKW57]GMG88527.1 hypothetical protein MNKW57_28480 [Microbulbifer sp. NKW57]